MPVKNRLSPIVESPFGTEYGARMHACACEEGAAIHRSQ